MVTWLLDSEKGTVRAPRARRAARWRGRVGPGGRPPRPCNGAGQWPGLPGRVSTPVAAHARASRACGTHHRRHCRCLFRCDVDSTQDPTAPSSTPGADTVRAASSHLPTPAGAGGVVKAGPGRARLANRLSPGAGEDSWQRALWPWVARGEGRGQGARARPSAVSGRRAPGRQATPAQRAVPGASEGSPRQPSSLRAVPCPFLASGDFF